jgi:acetylornithine deacetylase/succinyl-diaminopimelate desuccinylase-like protein
VSYTGKNVEAKKLFPAWKMNEDNAMVKEALKAVKGINEKAEISRYSFCTDGSESAGKRGITTVGFGPSKESMAHTNDEFIEIDELIKACEGYKAIAEAILR